MERQEGGKENEVETAMRGQTFSDARLKIRYATITSQGSVSFDYRSAE